MRVWREPSGEPVLSDVDSEADWAADPCSRASCLQYDYLVICGNKTSLSNGASFPFLYCLQGSRSEGGRAWVRRWGNVVSLNRGRHRRAVEPDTHRAKTVHEPRSQGDGSVEPLCRPRRLESGFRCPKVSYISSRPGGAAARTTAAPLALAHPPPTRWRPQLPETTWAGSGS